MPYLIAQSTHALLSKILIGLLIVSLIVGTPGEVLAKSEHEVLALAKAVVGKVLPIAEAKEDAVFPVAGAREPRKVMTVVATAYESKIAQTDSSPCIPAMAHFNLCEFYEAHGYGDTIAANFLPLGTRVRFPELFGDQVFTVRDRMNARYGHGRVDVWMPDGAREFGVKRLVMEVF